MVKTILNWIICALVLWLLSFIPFMYIYFRGIAAILIAAIVIGLISSLVVPAVKKIFDKSTPAVVLITSLIINAAVLWLGGLIVPGFSIEFFPTAIIAAAVLALLNTGFSAEKK